MRSAFSAISLLAARCAPARARPFLYADFLPRFFSHGSASEPICAALRSWYLATRRRYESSTKLLREIIHMVEKNVYDDSYRYHIDGP